MGIIDVSHHQGDIDFGQAAREEDGFYVKTTEGTGYVDPSWRDYVREIDIVRKPWGPYHFADGGDAATEANHFADQCLLDTSWAFRPVLDAEIAKLTPAWIKTFRTQFRNRMAAARRPYPARFRVYSSFDLLTHALVPAGWIDSTTDIWAARYNATLGWDHPQLVLWQNNDVARVVGLVGDVDTDQYMHGWTPVRDQAEIAPAAVAVDHQPVFMLLND